ncbi:hypothetical protein FHR48_001233 [Xanthomonas arboricola]|nr:hypothetical protein [Xanthomonas cannabis]NIK63721.1 hypothetical protein [Xanthomonas cannabis]
MVTHLFVLADIQVNLRGEIGVGGGVGGFTLRHDMRAVPIRRAAQDVAGKHLRCAQQDLGSEQAAIRMTKIQAPLFVSAVVLRDEGQHLFTQIRDIRRALAVRGV